MPAFLKSRDQFLIIGGLPVTENRHQHGSGRGLGVELADHRQRGLQTRHSDGEAGRGHRLATEARHQTVVTSAAADRTEANGAAFLVLDLEAQFHFENVTCVIFETAYDRRIDPDSICPYPELQRTNSAISSLAKSHLPKKVVFENDANWSRNCVGVTLRAAAGSNSGSGGAIARITNPICSSSRSAPFVKSPLSSFRPAQAAGAHLPTQGDRAYRSRGRR